ncbi:MAG: DNA polymerase III subunit alpha [Desulfovibrio sp.]|jgi:DNA polymerase-3 subunit alpha|nr:DNA polymerase III subunit alpha [Desulfovibrio sp.]
MTDFVHLHCHTEYSLLDGAIRIDELCAKAKDFGMPAVAITDHGNLHGALAFYVAARQYGLKPILGCEVYVCHDHRDKSSDLAAQRFHLVLLAQNAAGYHNLVKLVSHGALYGFYRRPRVDKILLRRYSEGIIALSACIAGEVPRTFQRQGMDAALAVAGEYADIYPGRFFLEMQANGLQEQEVANDALREIAAGLSLPLVATNDCHYLNADDADAHDVLLCIQTQAKITDKNRLRFATRELYYKSPEEMEKAFAHIPEALSNAGRIADMCGDYDFDFKTYHFPRYDLPEGVTLEDEFRRLSRQGLKRRLEKMPYHADSELYEKRLEMELDVICSMGFSGYFLIVQDFINWAKDNGIPVGPGRGSAAGSLAAYALRITNLDPIPYNLLFERFLNSERISMPDIDVDFCESKRQRVIDYMSRKYGTESVAQITTFGKMLAKGAVRDVGRALGMSFQETDRIAKLIPADLKMTIAKAMDLQPDLRALYHNDPEVKNLMDTSMRLEGMCRHASIHAAGLVVSDRPMTDYLPVYRGKREEDVVTQFDMKWVEKVGLVKFDFLGLRNMTIIDDTLKNIAAQGKEAPDMDALPLSDPETYKLYAGGDTDGVFQVESSGMRQYLRQLRPSVFEDIIAMLALYRPGPLKSGMVTEFIKRKHGQLKVSYPLSSLENCLKDTYGVIVYQEQVMQIAQIVAGYTLGGADLLRRAMGKKDPSAMSAERSKFVAGATQRGVNKDSADEIFDLMEKFAEYGFNKSHSAAYALISYHTAYLKSHYPTEFMAALLSSEIGDQDKLLKYMAACKDMGVKVRIPSIQESAWKFTVQGRDIVFGLGAIKNVGEEGVKALVKEREDNGPFTSLLDFYCRVSPRKVTKRMLESLIKGGACDCLRVSRAGMLASLDAVVARAQKKAKEKDSNQVSLLSMMGEENKPAVPGIGFDCPEATMPEWPNDSFSRYEKEALGFFFTSHPLQPYRKEIIRQRLTPLEECRELPPDATFKCAVLATPDKLRFDAKKRRWALLHVEDLTASGMAFCFSDAYELYKDILLPDAPLYMEGKISRNREEEQTEIPDGEETPLKEIKFIVEKIMLLADACAASEEPVCIDLPVDGETLRRLPYLKEVIAKHKGKTPVHVMLHFGDSWCRMALSPSHAVTPGPHLEEDLGAWAREKA